MASQQAGARPARELVQVSARLQQWARFASADPANPLTGRQAQLIAVLGASNRTGALAAELGVTPAVVSNMMKLLEERGLVGRAIRHGDQRAWVFELTEAGISARDHLRDRQLAAFTAALAPLSADEVRAVADTLALLERLVDRSE